MQTTALSGSKRLGSIFEGVLAAYLRSTDAAGVEWNPPVFRKVKEEVTARRELTVARMVKLAPGKSGQLLSLRRERHADHDSDMDLRDEIQRIALERAGTTPSAHRNRLQRPSYNTSS
jgi:hypothetical protein